MQFPGSVETCVHLMTQAGLQKIRSHLAAVEALLAHAHDGRADEEALLEFRRLCWAALLLTEDAECHRQIDLLVQHAKELYSGHELEPVDSPREKIRGALDAFRLRLSSLESGYGKRWRDLRAA